MYLRGILNFSRTFKIKFRYHTHGWVMDGAQSDFINSINSASFLKDISLRMNKLAYILFSRLIYIMILLIIISSESPVSSPF